MELVRFFSVIVKIALVLAMLGELKSCTVELCGLAATKSGQGTISYSKFTRLLTNGREP